ncbi:MAG: hypothetical protein IPP14_13460 [Planctomycetes bacterium]|nr:hypothetical protein [Planctomycetota bacterium]
MSYILYLIPAALVSGMVLGVAGSRDLKRGLLRGALNTAYILGGMAALAVLVSIAENPAW